ncbi:MAG: NmrA family NAD(P)-binding protein [Planctomycetaceae bacterium]|jgi:NADH dehydrogenase|nr:NmrA family NAD(P)-binding protein [Planctomycetaceae bacterium]
MPAFSHKNSVQTEIHAITGAFGYSGKYIARRLLAQGKTVRTLTNSVDKQNEFCDKMETFPLTFDDLLTLQESLTGVSVLYNTYWVRFNHQNFRHSIAVENTQKLFMAAKQVGVRRIVHTSITNPSEDSPLEYFSGKSMLETALQESGIAHSILRPTVLFGNEDILINNIAWLLRRFPVFGVFGDGQYKLQPIFVDDFAALAVEQGMQTDQRTIINAIGPETFTYRELVEVISQIVLGKKRMVISIPNEFGLVVSKILGLLTGDVLITKAEIMGLRQNLLYVNTLPTGLTRLTDWLTAHRNTIGKNYASELKRRM